MTILTRRRAAIATCCAPLLAASPGRRATAQQGTTYPARPITVIVPAPPGGSTDLAVRVISDHVLRDLGQPLVIDNRGGGGGLIGLRAAARAAPDGYTLVVGNPGPVAVAPHTTPDLGYDVLADFEPISMIMRLPLVLVVRNDLPVRNVQELVAHIRTNPGSVAFGTAGQGQTPHMAAELFQRVTGLDLVISPFRGSSPAVNAMLAGTVQGGFDTVGTLPYIREGRLRALAVGSRERSPLLPDVPTMTEAGFPGFVVTTWFVLMAPARTPPAIIARLNGAVTAALNEPQLRQRLATANAEAIPSTPDGAREFLRAELENWGGIVRQIGTG
jgi:tripartite-type tricarboxylate transporter receptor subunit TctC